MNKNLIRGIGLIFCLLFFPLIVSADVGLPDIKPYDVIVTNKDGIKLEDSYNNKTIVIPYDTKLTINMEYYDSKTKVYYGYVEYNGVSGEIDLNNTKMVSDKINLDDFVKLDAPHKVYTIDEVEMYKGPSKMYGRVSDEKVIPKGSTISYEYCDDIWAYVEYDGTKGWIVIYPYGNIYEDLKTSVVDFAPEGKNKVLLTENVTKLKVDPTKDEEISVNIPKETILEYEYSYKSLKSEYLYVNYEGIKGWLLITYYNGPYSAVGIVENNCSLALIMSDNIYIYSERGVLSSKTNEKIVKGAEVEVIYDYYLEDASWYYVSYNGENVWIAEVDGGESTNILYNWGTVSIYRTKEDIDVYEFPSKNAKKVSKIDADTDVTEYFYRNDSKVNYNDEYYSWSYLKTDNIVGWVLTSKLEKIEEKDKELCNVLNGIPEYKDEEDKSEEKNDKKDKSLTPAQMAIIGVSGAVVLALVVIVVLAIVNKKKINN